MSVTFGSRFGYLRRHSATSYEPMTNTLSMNKGVYNIPKLTTVNYEQWFEHLGYALDFNGLKKFLNHENFEDYCKGKCISGIKGFRKEVCRENNDINVKEEDFLEDIINEIANALDPIGKKTIATDMKETIKKQKWEISF